MKQFKRILKKILVITILCVITVGAGYLALKYMESQSVTTVENPAAAPSEPTPDEYEERVEDMMKDTADQWEEKHRVWAEQEVSKQIIAEQEQRLEKLREKELSLQ